MLLKGAVLIIPLVAWNFTFELYEFFNISRSLSVRVHRTLYNVLSTIAEHSLTERVCLQIRGVVGILTSVTRN